MPKPCFRSSFHPCPNHNSVHLSMSAITRASMPKPYFRPSFHECDYQSIHGQTIIPFICGLYRKALRDKVPPQTRGWKSPRPDGPANGTKKWSQNLHETHVRAKFRRIFQPALAQDLFCQHSSYTGSAAFS